MHPSFLPEGHPPPAEPTAELLLLIGIPFAIVDATFGRRFAMFGARARALGGLGSGWMGSIFSLTRFAFFDLSVIWGHALFGAVLIVVGGYCAAVPLHFLARPYIISGISPGRVDMSEAE